VESGRVRVFVLQLLALDCLLIRLIAAVLLIRTYAFFSRNVYVLWFLLSALSGMVAYQLYVDTTQMLRSFRSYVPTTTTHPELHTVLPFVKPPFVRRNLIQRIPLTFA
jgi:hypothetical protein